MKIGGTVSIETAREVQSARDEVIGVRKEVYEIARILYETSELILDGEGRYGGMTKPHKDAIRRQSRRLKQILASQYPNLEKEIAETIRRVNEARQ